MALKKKPKSEESPNGSGAPTLPGTDQPVPEFYANSIFINVSPFELELQNLLVDSQQNVKGAVNVRMSPQTAYTLSRALNKQLEEYERQCGPIALPAELRDAMD